jgi:hypothetical protein
MYQIKKKNVRIANGYLYYVKIYPFVMSIILLKVLKNGEFQVTFTRVLWYHDWPSHHMHRRRDDIYILYNIHVSSWLYTPVCILWKIYIFLQKVSNNVYKYSTVIFTINEHVRRAYSIQHVQPNKMFVRHLSVENNHSGIVT